MDNIENNKAKNFIKYYDQRQIQSMNFIFGKSNSNNWFTQEELAFACNIDLYSKENLENAKNDWLNINFE